MQICPQWHRDSQLGMLVKWARVGGWLTSCQPWTIIDDSTVLTPAIRVRNPVPEAVSQGLGADPVSPHPRELTRLTA